MTRATATGTFELFLPIFVFFIEEAVLLNVPAFKATVKFTMVKVGFNLFLSIYMKSYILTLKFSVSVICTKLLSSRKIPFFEITTQNS